MPRKTRELVPVTAEPLNAEAPPSALEGEVTPAELFYVRDHFPIPALEAESWRLAVSGMVGAAREFSLREIRALGERSQRVTLECAGNGRKGMSPLPPGTPWGYGAVSTGRFTGVPLAPLLEAVGVAPGVSEVVFTGADRGVVEGREIPFARSLPLAVARHPDVLLAWALNGAPLTPEHGFPLRLVVPGWYAMASVKWLRQITLRAEPFRGYFQATHYVYRGEGGTADGEPVTHMRPRALILGPAPEAEVAVGRPAEIHGIAWSGRGPVRRVEISLDGGGRWSVAELETSTSPHAHQRWRLPWTPHAPGPRVLLARATDAAGHTQPLTPPWNELGYGNNGVRPVSVTVAG